MNQLNAQIPELNASFLCVDSYTDSIPEGRFYDSGSNREFRFSSLMQLLQCINSSAQGTDAGSSDPMHEFLPPAPTANRPGPTRLGTVATFSLRILFRQNTSWQGSVIWLEGKTEQSFRSALELIFLLDSALEKS